MVRRKSAIAYRLIVAAPFVLCASRNGTTLGGQPAIPPEARTSWSRYMEFAPHIQGTSSHTVTDRRANGQVISQIRVSLNVRDFSMAYGFQYFGPQPAATQHAYVRNESYGFEVRRKADVDPWVLAQLHEKIGDGRKIALSRFLNEQTTRTHAPLYLYRQWVPDIVEDKRFVVKKCAKWQSKGMDLVRIDFTYHNQDHKPAMQSGWFALDPSLSWVISQYTVDAIWGSDHSGTVAYSAEFKRGTAGMPLLVRAVEKTDCPGEETNVDREIKYDLSEGTPAAVEFTLKPFGLPEIVNVNEKRSSLYLWLAAGGFVALSASALLRVRSQKRKHAANLALKE